MKRLILSALVLAAASQAAGCIIVSDDDPTGDALVSWSLLSADQNGNPIAAGCPAGATSAIVYSLRQGAPAGDAFIDKFDCAAGSGRAADLPTGTYLVWVRLTDTSEAVLHAESGSLITTIADGATTPVNHSIYVDHAFYQVGWNLNAGGVNASCSQVQGEDGVSIAASFGGGGLIDTIVDCEAGEGGAQTLTDPLPSTLAGSQYTISVALLNAAQDPIGIAPAIPASPDRALRYGNQFVDLGIVTITLD